jgi:hypothetical protein
MKVLTSLNAVLKLILSLLSEAVKVSSLAITPAVTKTPFSEWRFYL